MDSFSDIAFFTLLVKQGSMAATAQELGLTPPAVSKRLALLEKRLGVRLLQRTTRQISLTPEGETYLTEGAHVLASLEELERSVSGSGNTPKGVIKIGATLGFGRSLIAPAIAKFSDLYPGVEVQLTLNDRPMNIVEKGLDVVIRFGELPDVRLSARLLANNHRILCAAPSYLNQAGEPEHPKDLSKHQCLFIREADESYGTWHFHQGQRTETIKVQGPLTSNDGESVLKWALEGRGIMVRSIWDADQYIRSGQLKIILLDWKLPSADIYAVFPTRNNLSAKTRAFVDFLLEEFSKHRGNAQQHW
ncbi:LysR family transcriptional regulator [Polynucleobacter sp. AP-Nino-20-G2]|uniref:LysR family transcriptional regulator n=1 Tax=Polynucleobacter sp. AP-Nino-20-G2 TaxID=2576917 RepID=UPI001BFD7053|nr:LysR family transcriptional regulator [Polynucleobacter sp. AP-Nino-20-G2]QWE16224.1 LysR family transcriptional regulator [Polynucleobacter sp. AP-Nino-20-G2]